MRIEPWGLTPVCDGEERFPEAPLPRSLPEGRFLVRGMARSYGDACLQKQLVNSRKWTRLLSFDGKRGLLRAESGLSLAAILEFSVPRGWFLPVTPGTKWVSLGGAIASDVHGKNHHVAGSFSRHIESIEIILPSGEVALVSRKKRADLFAATCGGMGLTGVIKSAVLRLEAIESAWILQTVHPAEGLDDLMGLVEKHGQDPFTVAWLDVNVSGKRLGRGHLITGRWASAREAREAGIPDGKRFALHGPPRLSLPFYFPNFVGALANAFGFKLMSWFYHRLPRAYGKPKLVHYDGFFYPLDVLDRWNRAYGKNGFLQWQCVIPTGRSAEGVRQILERCRKAGLGSFVTVLKLFGEGNGFPLSFPREGYILCLDFAASAKLYPVLDELDAIVGRLGGRIYLAKDARMSAKTLAKGYPGLASFLKLKKRIDPEGRLASLQAERLGLVRPAAKPGRAARKTRGRS